MTSILTLALLGTLGFGQSGTPALALLKVAQGPRAAAMGGSYIALAGDAYGLTWNPAGPGQVRDYHLAFSHHQWFAGITDEALCMALPGNHGAFSMNLLYSAEPDIEYWNERNEPGGSFRTWTGLAGLGYGGTIAGNWHLGFGLKGFYQSLHTSQGYGGALDIGFLGRPLPFLGLGLVGRNIGLIRYPGVWEELPTEAGFGASYRGRELTVTADAVYPLDGPLDIRVGLEYAPVTQLALRAGYRTGSADISSLGWLSGLTAGVGLSLGGFGVDYTVSPYGGLGITHRIGIEGRFIRKGEGALLIRTVDRQGLRPMTASVALSGVVDLAIQTDRIGEAELVDLLPGRLVIRTSRTGYIQRVDTLRILGDREQYATIALTAMEYGSVWGAVYSAATGQPVGGTVSYSGPVYGEQSIPENSGTFALHDIPVGEYVIEAATGTDVVLRASRTVNVVANAVTEVELRVSTAAPAEDGDDGLSFPPVRFDEGSAGLRPEEKASLNRIGNALQADPDVSLELSGHAEPSELANSGFASCQELSEARAQSVYDYLVGGFDLDAERLVLLGLADSQPAGSNETESGREANRRVEFRALD